MLNSSSALVVGISAYHHIRPLPTSVINDATSIHALVGSPQLGYPPDNTTRLLDGEATGDAIRQALQTLTDNSVYESTVLIYFSGHGAQIVSGPHVGAYLLPVDARFGSEEELAQTSVFGAEFTEALRKIRARRVVVIFDCCHSGGIGQPKNLGGAETKSGLPENYYQQLAQGSGRAIIASSRENEVSWVFPGETNSLFTKYLLQGLRGKALKVGNVIRVFDLFDYIQPLVTGEQPNQHPVFKAELEENFPIALLPVSETKELLVSAPKDSFEYDLFVSYRRVPEDRTWVKKTFVPALKAVGLRVCLDDTCFRLGRPLVKEMERAVEQSRYTLAVFSPDYMESGFTDLEKAMAQYLEAETRIIRLISVIYRECKPELSIRHKLMLDMRDEMEFEDNVQRIAYECFNSE